MKKGALAVAQQMNAVSWVDRCIYFAKPSAMTARTTCEIQHAPLPP